MDTEDRDHFKTIAYQRAEPRRNSSTADSYHSALDPSYCLQRAKILFGCYRRDEAHDPETFCAAIAAIFSEYTKEVVDYVTDPRTGLPSSSNFLPTVAEVRSACSAHAARAFEAAKPKRYALPLPTRKPMVTPNLFVPYGFKHYDKMVERSKKEEPHTYKFDNKTCSDGAIREGIWVPHHWWTEVHLTSDRTI